MSPTGGARGLLPGAWRPAALGLAFVGVLVAVVLGLTYRGEADPGVVDAIVDPALAVGAPTARRLLWGVVLLGNPTVTAVSVVVIATVSALLRRWSAAVLAVGGVGLAAALTEYVLKPGVARTLDGTLAFPSGHTTTSAAVASVLLVLLVDARWPRRSWARVLLAALVVGCAAGVALSLIALGLHYTTDTVGGVAVSVAVVVGVAVLVDGVAGAFARSSAPAAPGPRRPDAVRCP